MRRAAVAAAVLLAACATGPAVDRTTWAPVACTTFRLLDRAAADGDDRGLVAASVEASTAMGTAAWDGGGEIRDALGVAAREARGTVLAHEGGQHQLSEESFESMVRALARAYRGLQAAGLDCGGPPSIGVA